MTFTQDRLLQAQSIAVVALRSTRPKLLDAFGRIEHKHKIDSSVVTELDVWAEEQYISKLKIFDSGIGFLGEEHGAEGSELTRWLVDPIDGTEYFIRGMPGCVNMLTLIVDDKPAVSAIYDFVQDKMYTAVTGLGATLNNEKIFVSERTLDRAWVDVEDQGRDLSTVQKVKNSGAKSIRIPVQSPLYVARGMIEGYIVVGGRGEVWDYAPRALLIQEAGGRVANIGSDAYDYHEKSFIASNYVIFEELRKLVEKP